MTREEADAVKLYLAEGGLLVEEIVQRVFGRVQKRHRKVQAEQRREHQERLKREIEQIRQDREAALEREVDAARAKMGHLSGMYLGKGPWRTEDG